MPVCETIHSSDVSKYSTNSSLDMRLRGTYVPVEQITAFMAIPLEERFKHSNGIATSGQGATV
jgi:hypothetical protein